MKYKNFNIPDDAIDNLMDKLDISIVDACEMYLSDHDLVENETVEELTKKANKNRVTATIHDAKGEKKERKPREKKENPLKKEIIQAIYSVIADEITSSAHVFVRNDEKYIDFLIQYCKEKKITAIISLFDIDLYVLSKNIFELLFGIGKTATNELGGFVSTHNDIVTSIIGFGIVGFLLFIYYMVLYPIKIASKNVRLFIILLTTYTFVEYMVLEPVFRATPFFMMFYFFILRYVMIEKLSFKTILS